MDVHEHEVMTHDTANRLTHITLTPAVPPGEQWSIDVVCGAWGAIADAPGAYFAPAHVVN